MSKINWSIKSTFAAAISFVAVGVAAFEYNVTRPTICPQWRGAEVGKWTMDREAALAKAKAEGAYTIVLFTGSWWCPICQTCEAKVLTSQAWADYVAKRGYYLVEYDYPYRFPVPEGQEWKGTSPLGDGWGFQCWLYNADYLSENGLTADEGLAAIQKMYDYQDALALPGSTVDVIGRLGGGTMELHKIAYPSMVLFSPDGSEVGRVMFPRPWYQDSAVSDEEAIDYMIENLEAVRNGGSTDLFSKPGAGGIAGTAAQTYDVALSDADGSPVGVGMIKTSKRNARTDVITVTASIQIADGRKVSLKGTASGAEGEKIYLSKNGSPVAATLTIGAEGVVGTCTDGSANYKVQGARNPFKGKDDASKARAATLKKDFWTFALADSGKGGSQFTRGYSSFSVTTAANGKVKITGVLGDGSKVTLSAQALLGEGGKVLVPVIGKKGAFSMMLEFDNWKLSAVKGVSGWKSAKTEGDWLPDAIFAADAGAGTVSETMYLQIEGFDSAAGIGGKAIAVSPKDDAVLAEGRKWTGTKGVTDLKITFTQKDGTFKGKFNIYVTDGGRIRKLKANVGGVVVNGVPYGTAVILNVGTWAVKLTGSCGGGC